MYIVLVDNYTDYNDDTIARPRLSPRPPSVAECGGTTRHYRDRQRDSNTQSEEADSNLFLDLIDTLHFNVFHLEHVGLRVPLLHNDDDLKADDDDDECEEDLVDAEVRRVAAEIHHLRSQFAFERIDNTKNSKFTIKAQEEQQATSGGA